MAHKLSCSCINPWYPYYYPSSEGGDDYTPLLPTLRTEQFFRRIDSILGQKSMGSKLPKGNALGRVVLMRQTETPLIILISRNDPVRAVIKAHLYVDMWRHQKHFRWNVRVLSL